MPNPPPLNSGLNPLGIIPSIGLSGLLGQATLTEAAAGTIGAAIVPLAVAEAALFVTTAVVVTAPVAVIGYEMYTDYTNEQRRLADVRRHASIVKVTLDPAETRRLEKLWAASAQEKKETWAKENGFKSWKDYRLIFRRFHRVATYLHAPKWEALKARTIFLPKNKPGDQFRRIRK